MTLFNGFDFLKPVAKKANPIDAADSYNLIAAQNRIQWLLLITQQPIPTGKFATPLAGDRIGAVDNYILLYENKSPNPVGVRVLADLSGGGVPGKQVKLALDPDKTDIGVVDYLGDSAGAPSFNKRLSDTIVLLPNAKLWINTAATAFPLTAGDKIRIRVFDPGEFILSSSWELK